MREFLLSSAEGRHLLTMTWITEVLSNQQASVKWWWRYAYSEALIKSIGKTHLLPNSTSSYYWVVISYQLAWGRRLLWKNILKKKKLNSYWLKWIGLGYVWTWLNEVWGKAGQCAAYFTHWTIAICIGLTKCHSNKTGQIQAETGESHKNCHNVIMCGYYATRYTPPR